MTWDTALFIVYLEFTFNWASCIVSGTQTPAHPELPPPLERAQRGQVPILVLRMHTVDA